MKKSQNPLSRRSFLRSTLFTTAGLTIFPRLSFSRSSDPLKLGFIGLGRQANYLQDSFLRIDGVEVVAGSDVYAIKRKRFKSKAEEYYAENRRDVKVKVYKDYKKLLNRKDIDGVVIAAPDHWHARIAIDACEAGKDIYLEKPLTFTIKEGQELIKAVRDNDVVLAVGSQQRSDPNFQHAVNLVQEGKLGKIKEVQVFLGEINPHPKPYNEPKEALPEGLDWEMWTGPAPLLHYNHVLNPPISMDPRQDEEFWGAWRWYKELGGGLMTDWGAHMMDIAQWGLGVDRSGPVKITPIGFKDNQFLSYEYENGIKLIHKPFNEEIRGVKFWGEDAWIEVARGFFNTSDPTLSPELNNKDDVPYEGKAVHHKNFINCMKSRQDPAAPVEIGHKSAVACTLGNIAAELGRPVQWDPDKEVFINDPEAEKFYHREYRNGYSL